MNEAENVVQEPSDIVKPAEHVIVRFWGKVEKTEECWNWTAGINTGGYGQFSWNRRNVTSHRMSWIITYGSFPEKCCLHRCDNPKCVRPDHLFDGTPKDNYEDMRKKWRQNWAYGERARSAKLTSDQVLTIRRLHSEGEIQRRIAEKFGVSFPTICQIIKRVTWNHI